MIRSLLILPAFTVLCSHALAAPPRLPEGFKAINDLAYTDKDHPRQKLNAHSVHTILAV